MGLNLNKVIIAGYLTQDPELRQTQSGKSVVTFTVAVNRSVKNDDNTYRQETDFIDCQAWDKRAEFLSRNFRKGSAVCVLGGIRKRSWTDSSGTKRYATEVLCEDILFAGVKSAQEGEEARGGVHTPQTPSNAPAEPDFSAPAAQPNFTELNTNEDLPF